MKKEKHETGPREKRGKIPVYLGSKEKEKVEKPSDHHPPRGSPSTTEEKKRKEKKVQKIRRENGGRTRFKRGETREIKLVPTDKREKKEKKSPHHRLVRDAGRRREIHK